MNYGNPSASPCKKQIKKHIKSYKTSYTGNTCPTVLFKKTYHNGNTQTISSILSSILITPRQRRHSNMKNPYSEKKLSKTIPLYIGIVIAPDISSSIVINIRAILISICITRSATGIKPRSLSPPRALSFFIRSAFESIS